MGQAEQYVGKKGARGGGEHVENKSFGLERHAGGVATGLSDCADKLHGFECDIWMKGVSCDAVGVEEIPDDELLQLFAGHLAVPVLVDDLHVRGDVCCGRLEAFVHGAVAVHQPFGHLDGLAHAVAVAVVGLDYFADLEGEVPGEISALIASKKSAVLDWGVVGVEAALV